MASSAEADDATHAPDAPPLAPNPDAQTTVNDFLDYTDFFPSDLVRSLTLIADLDISCVDAVQHVHDLTALLHRRDDLPEHDRPDPADLRRDIARSLNKAITQREHAYAEAIRLHDVAQRHYQRSTIIKTKLKQQPEPPSRDPTPPPVSPSAARNSYRQYDRMRLHFDGRRTSGGRARAYSMSSSGSDSEDPSVLASRRLKQPKDRSLKAPRVRTAGIAGTNVHSAVAGISTSNALAKLSPPPSDARPGSRWAPWMRLTEYEMAVLRKQMKKNAVWTPSLTMVTRELERKHRTEADYLREKARCEATGEILLDEQPETLQPAAPPPVPESAPVVPPVEAIQNLHVVQQIQTVPVESVDSMDEDSAMHPTRDTRRQQAMRAVQDLENATRKIQDAADGLKELTFSAHDVATASTPKPPLSARLPSKRKRDNVSYGSADDDDQSARDDSTAQEVSEAQQPEQKRLRLQLPAPTMESATPSTATPVSARALTPDIAQTPVGPAPSDDLPTENPEPEPTAVPPVEIAPIEVATTEVDPVEVISAITKQIPLAPAGPGTPKTGSKPAEQAVSRELTPAPLSPTEDQDPLPTEPVPPPALLSSTATAASSRSRRESVAPKGHSSPQPSKSAKSESPAPTNALPAEPAIALRPRAGRGHVPTPKAQSEEPNPNEAGRVTRRHSIFGQSVPAAPQTTRMSTRRKPPPKGEITAAENGQKTVTNVKRAQGSKNKKKKKAEEEPDVAEEIDPNEPKYCICDDVSYGPMISCDNNCDKEWFHLPCMNMTEEDIPSRRAKWYCPDCREALGTDAYGNPKVPPPLPGRRGNR